MRTLQILKAARALIERPESWTKGVFAALRDDDGDVADVGTFDARANCFCAWGAVRRASWASGDDWAELGALSALGKALDKNGDYLGGTIAIWNDEPYRTHAEVLALFDRAIEQETNRESMA